MIKDLKKGIIQGIGFILILGLFGISYAAVTSVSSGNQLTASLFNEQMVPTGFVGAFYGSSCPAGWTKADGSGDEKMVDGTLGSLDLRGEFIRGWVDNKIGIDDGRILASYQSDGIGPHRHNIGGSAGQFPAPGGTGIQTVRGDTSSTTYNAGNIGDGIGTETRPRNVALLYCIKN